MKAPLGTEVDLSPGHIVLDGDPAPPSEGTQQPPLFGHVYCGHGHPSQLHAELLSITLFENAYFLTFSLNLS